MDALIDAIRAAIANDASDEAKAAGAAACRTILGALEAKAGEPIPPPTPPPIPMPQVATALAALRGMPAEQLLDLAIARLRTLVPAGLDQPAVHKLDIPIIKLPAP